VKLADDVRRRRDEVAARVLQQANGVLHLGAHWGEEAGTYAAAGKPVLWVEALPAAYEHLVRHVAAYSNQRTVCALLGDVDGVRRRFHVSNNHAGVSSSLFDFGPYASGERSLWPDLELAMQESLDLTMVTLDTLVRELGVDPVMHDYWVLDLQGAEKLALLGARASLGACQALHVEVSQVEVYQGGVLWPDLRRYLEEQGFGCAWEPELAHDDVLFCRRSS